MRIRSTRRAGRDSPPRAPATTGPCGAGRTCSPCRASTCSTGTATRWLARCGRGSTAKVARVSNPWPPYSAVSGEAGTKQSRQRHRGAGRIEESLRSELIWTAYRPTSRGTGTTGWKPVLRDDMNADPLISAIIIFLDARRFLAEAVESVLAQTRGDWELLLCDDGSADGSTEIARDYAARHPGRIRYLEHPGHANRGMSATRNLGVRHARGELIALLDADDVWLPDKLAEQVPLLRAHPEAAMLFGRTHVWYGWTGDPADAARDYVTQFPFPPDT